MAENWGTLGKRVMNVSEKMLLKLNFVEFLSAKGQGIYKGTK